MNKFPILTSRALPAAICSLILLGLQSSAFSNERWLRKSGFGLMFHYEAFEQHNSQSFNQAVDSFDVDGFSSAVKSSNAGHVIFVVGQHWGRYCSPNKAYERLLGVGTGVWTSKRDLIKEIAESLHARDVRLILYMTARAPMRHYKVIKAMGDTLPSINGKPVGPEVDPMSHPKKLKGFLRSENQPPNPTFLRNWGEVCGEWSERYGKLVSGWWFDGYKMEMKDSYEKLKSEKYNIDSWIDAVLSGNPKAELAFNAGAHPILSLCTRGKLCPRQTFTSGENHHFLSKTKKGFGKALTPRNFPAPPGVVWHLLLPISKGWGSGSDSRFKVSELKSRIDLINAEGGVVTLDVPISASGKIPPSILETLRNLGKDINKLTDGRKSF